MAQTATVPSAGPTSGIDTIPRRQNLLVQFIKAQPLGFVGFLIILLYFVLALGAQWISPYDPEAVDFAAMGKSEVTYLKDALPKGGKVLEIRGLAGVFVDDEISKGIHAGIAENPQFEIVGPVHGDWAQDVAQKAVARILPSLPQVQPMGSCGDVDQPGREAVVEPAQDRGQRGR